jgi:chorismate mutase/prephenate dehydratase
VEEVDNIRKNIDGIDEEILRLLNDRADWALKIKKTSLGKTPIRPERESAIVREMVEKNQGPLPADAIRQIYTQIIASFRDELQLDKPVSVSYLGPAGSYSEAAAKKLFGATIDLQPENSVSEAIKAVENGSVNLAVVAIENSSEGAVRETHKLLQGTNVKIVAEISLPITHCLISKSEDISGVKKVYAHPQALGQCRSWLATHLPQAEQIPCPSNSAAAELASNNDGSAAIASREAADIYGLEVLKKGINDQAGNETRFIALGNLETRPTGQDKTSVVISLIDKPGALHEILGVLADAGITMTRLESQPFKKNQYVFYIDFVGHIHEKKVAEVLDKLDKSAKTCQVLGSYPMEVES